MKNTALLAIAALTMGSSFALAQSDTEKEVTQTIVASNEYSNKNLKNSPDAYSAKGALEFWSSGGLLQEIAPAGRPDEYESISIKPKNIRVLTLVEGQVAVAHYYAEGSMKPKGSSAVNHYMTRVTQVFVKEAGKWKVRSSHWSPIAGGSGTSQTTQ
ncbi:MAG: nuclear transport factor 2 family protein [Acidobacteriota bacterium]